MNAPMQVKLIHKWSMFYPPFAKDLPSSISGAKLIVVNDEQRRQLRGGIDFQRACAMTCGLLDNALLDTVGFMPCDARPPLAVLEAVAQARGVSPASIALD